MDKTVRSDILIIKREKKQPIIRKRFNLIWLARGHPEHMGKKKTTQKTLKLWDLLLLLNTSRMALAVSITKFLHDCSEETLSFLFIANLSLITY